VRTLIVCALFVACAPEPVRRCDAIHDIARALCDRALRCGTLARDDIVTCTMAQFGAICTENSCDGWASDAARVNACIEACLELDCAETQWPTTCEGATR